MEEQVQSQPNEIKIQQTMDEEEDRISDLHDALLLGILSRLDSTKAAIRTGVLSKRWQHLWPFVPSLSFYCHPKTNNGPPPGPDFFSFVNHTLTQCRQLNLNEFKLLAVYDIQFESLVNEWIRYVINLNVKGVRLMISTFDFVSKHNLDQICFINSHFTRLDLRGCILKPTGGISWTNLKMLSLGFGKVDEDLIENILSGSPVLETLNLLFVYGIRRIDISSKSVKSLRLGGCINHKQYPNIAHVQVNAPYISSLKIYGLISWKRVLLKVSSMLNLSKLVLLNVSSLVKAELDYVHPVKHSETMVKELEEETLKGLILKLRHVKELKIGDLCLEALSGLEAKGFTLPSNIKTNKT